MRVALAFLIVWLPYVAATGAAERGLALPVGGETLMLVAALAIVPAALLLKGRDPFALRVSGKAIRAFALMLAAGLALKAADLGLGVALGLAEAGAWRLPAGGALGMLLLSTFVPSLVEDVLTRGFPLFAARWRKAGPALLILISAALYVANHLWRFDWGAGEQLRLFAMGLAFAAAAWRWQSLWAAVGLHWGWNLAGALGGSAVTFAGETAHRPLSAALFLAMLVALVVPRGSQRRKNG